MHTRHFTNILISCLKTLTAKEVTFVFAVTMQSRLPVFRARFVETTRCLCAYKVFIHPRFSILYRVPPYRITSLRFSKTCFLTNIWKVVILFSHHYRLYLYCDKSNLKLLMMEYTYVLIEKYHKVITLNDYIS